MDSVEDQHDAFYCTHGNLSVKLSFYFKSYLLNSEVMNYYHEIDAVGFEFSGQR